MINYTKFIAIESSIKLFSKQECSIEVWNCSCSCENTLSFGLLCAPGLHIEECEHICEEKVCNDNNNNNNNNNNNCGICEDECIQVCPDEFLNYDGELIMDNYSNAEFKSSNITINQGSFITNGNNYLNIENTNILIENGYWINLESSFIDINNSSSLIIKEGGNFTISDNSKFYLSNQSLIEIIYGNLLIEGSYFDIYNSNIIVNNGILSFEKNLISNIKESYILLIDEGNILIRDNSYNTFKNTTIEISNGILELFDKSSSKIEDNSNLIVSSSIILNEFSILEIENNSFGSIDGNIMIKNNSLLNIINYSSLIINNNNNNINNINNTTSGNIILNDNSLLNIFNSSFISLNGNLEIYNTSIVNIDYNSSLIIEGNGILFLSNSAFMEIKNNSFVNITKGSVIINDNSFINISDNSMLITNDLLDLHGDISINLPIGNRFIIDNNGYFNIRKKLNFTNNNNNNNNNYNDNTISSIQNYGIFDMSLSNDCDINIPIDNDKNGLISFGISKYNLKNGIKNSGKLYFDKSTIDLNNYDNYNNEKLNIIKGGQVQGRLNLIGDFINEGDIVHDSKTGSLFEIDGNYKSSTESTIYITIENTKSPGLGYSMINIKNQAELNGKIIICIPENADLGNIDKLDVMKFTNRIGEFNDIQFACTSKHKTSTFEKDQLKNNNKSNNINELKIMKSVNNGCTSSEYSSGSFTVLFNGCNDSSTSKKQQEIFQWMSLGFLIFAIILILLSIIIYDRISIIRRFIKGKESSRIESVRKVQRKNQSQISFSDNHVESSTIL